MNGGNLRNFLIALLMLASVEGVRGQCNTGSITLETCNPSYTLVSRNLAGYNYKWFSCGLSYSNPVQISFPSASVTVFPANTTNNQTFFYYYEEIDQNPPYSICISAVHTLKYDYELEITNSNPSGPGTLSVQAFTSINGYSSHQWYQNGTLIPGATASTFVAFHPGNYYLIATASCGGSRTSNTLTVDCAAPGFITRNNYQYPTGQTISSGVDYHFQGKIEIMPNADVTIEYARIFMDACSEIILNKGSNANNGGKLTLTNCVFYGCDGWNGIYVIGKGVDVPQSPSSGNLTMTNTQIWDAEIGVYGVDNGIIDIENCLFQNNYLHLYLTHYQKTSQPIGPPVTIYYPEINIRDTRFSYLSETVTGCTPTITVTIPNGAERKMVCLDDVTTIKLSSDTFQCTDLGANHDQNAIEAHNVLVGNSPWRGLEAYDCKITGDFNIGILIEDATDVYIDGNLRSMSGDLNTGIKLKNVDYANISGCMISETGATITDKSGIISDQCNHVEMQTNTVDHFERGIEFYSTDFANVEARFYSNEILSNTYGFAYSPVEFPVGASNQNNQYMNNANNKANNIELYCNRFLDNTFGIIGSGPFTDQGDATHDWANRFCQQHTSSACTSGSSSGKADIVWMNEDGNNNFSSAFDAHSDQSGGANRALTKLTGNYTLTLNGKQFVAVAGAGSGSHYTPVAVGGNFNYSCPNNVFQKRDIDDDKNPLVDGYPNPAKNKIYFDKVAANDHITAYRVFDVTGRCVIISSTKPRPFFIDVEQLPAGLYSIAFENAGGLVTTAKFVKAN